MKYRMVTISYLSLHFMEDECICNMEVDFNLYVMGVAAFVSLKEQPWASKTIYPLNETLSY
jgi:hypothetical protein